MSPAPYLGRLELRRFAGSRLTRAALVAVMAIPLLYSGLYLWAFWNPLGHLDRLPAALVQLDTPATVDGRTISAGADLARELTEREIFDWRRVTPTEAEAGVHDGRYYVALTIPADFSERLGSPAGDGTPEPAYLDVRLNQSRNYLIKTIADSAFSEIRAAVAKNSTEDYLDKIFLSFGEMHGKTREAANGAGRLANGAAEAEQGAGELHTGLGKAEGGAAKLAGGLGTATSGTDRLAAGLRQAGSGITRLSAGADKLAGGVGKALGGGRKLAAGLGKAAGGVRKLAAGAARLDKGAARLAAGNAKVYDTVHRFAGLVDKDATEAAAFLKAQAPEIRELGLLVAETIRHLSCCLDDLPRLVHQAREHADLAQRQIKEYLDAHPVTDPALSQVLKAALDTTTEFAGLAGGVDDFFAEHPGEPAWFQREAQRIAALATRLADLTPALSGQVEQARHAFDRLDSGLGRLADGANAVYQGVGKAAAGVRRLDAGMTRLSTGAAGLGTGLGRLLAGANKIDAGLGRLKAGTGALVAGAGSLSSGMIRLSAGADELKAGLARLTGGAGRLESGLGELHAGSGKLADGLAEGAREIPDYDATQREDRVAMMADPVRLNTRVSNEVPNYGTGFAPYFLPLSLWVGSMITYMLLRPLNPRVVAGRAPAWRAALAGWMPAAFIGVMQVALISAVLAWGLGLDAGHWPGLIGLLLLTSFAFMAVVQALLIALGPAGRVLALALLMLQLTSSGGTYPIQTSPGFFQAISPWLPMTWVVSAIRVLIGGGDLTVAWQTCAVLVLYALAGLALTTYAAPRARMWTIARLHPVLEI